MSSGNFIDRIEKVGDVFHVHVHHSTLGMIEKTPKELDEMLRWAPISDISDSDKNKIEDALRV